MVRNCRGAALKDAIFCGCDKHNQTLHQHSTYNMSEKCKDGDAPMPEVCFYSEDGEAGYLAAMSGEVVPADAPAMKACMADCMDFRSSLSTDQSKYCEAMCTGREDVQTEIANSSFCDVRAGVLKSCGECWMIQEDCEIPDEDGNCPRLCQPPADEPAAAPAAAPAEE